MAYNKTNPNGQATMANSGPVVIASDQSAVPVSVSGVATAANQTTGNTSLSTIAGAVSGTEMQVDVLTMPTVAVTATDLDIRNLAPATDTIAIGDGSATATIRNLASNDALNVAIVDGSGSHITSFGGGTQYTEDAAAAADPVGNALIVVRDDVQAGSITSTDGDNIAVRGNNLGEMYVADNGSRVELATISSNTGILSSLVLETQQDDLPNTADGLQTTSMGMVFDGSTWDRLRGDSTNGMLVNLGANNDVTVTGSVTVSATDLDIRNLVNTDVVTAELSAVDNAVLDAIAASVSAIDTDTTTLIGHVDGLETSNSAIQTAVQLLDDTVQVLGTDTYTEASSKGITLGAVRRDADTTLVNTTNEFTPLQVDANGRLKVEAFSGETLPVSLASNTPTLQAGTAYVGKVRLTDGTTDGEIVPLAGYNAQAVAIVDGSGAQITSFGGGTEFAEDAAHSSGALGKLSLGVRRDTPTTMASADGDYHAMTFDANGALHVNMATTLDAANDAVAIGSTAGCSPFKTLDLDETEEEVKGTAGKVYGYYYYNANTSVRYLKWYNATAASVTVGTTTPIYTFPLPASSGAHVGFSAPLAFTTAITVAATTGLADADTGAPSANDVILNVFYI